MPIDLRAQKLAKFIVKVKKIKADENVILSGGVESQELLSALYKEVLFSGAHPILKVSLPELNAFFYNHAKPHQINKYPEHTEYLINKSQKYIGIHSESNTRELANCNPKKITQRAKITRKISDLICNNKPRMDRCTVAFPCVALAQEANMSLTEYENFVYSACLQDWSYVKKITDKLKKIFREGSKVHLLGENVDLKFKVHGKKAMSDLDFDNLPAGEFFMAPIRETLNGWIKFDYPAIEDGKEVTDIKLEFRDGKVISSKASKNEDFLKSMLETDENASYVGEFGIGCNPKVNRFTKNLLFDEKIGGTIHLALGMAYKQNGGGNDSAIHWDIVKDMHKAKIIVDGKIIQQNGKWKI